MASSSGPLLPGADGAERTVFRSALVPPFDVTQYASPLAGFRQYTEPNGAQLFDKTLLTVKGLPQGVPVRIAALDSYDDFVWGAGKRRQRRHAATPPTVRASARSAATSRPRAPVTR